jgi:hypothetical protein
VDQWRSDVRRNTHGIPSEEGPSNTILPPCSVFTNPVTTQNRDCPDVTDDDVFQWIEDGLNVKAITSKYKACFEDLSSPNRRAKRLKARIVEEIGEGHGNANLSEELLIDWFDTGRDDDQIVKLYRQNHYFVKNQI